MWAEGGADGPSARSVHNVGSQAATRERMCAGATSSGGQPPLATRPPHEGCSILTVWPTAGTKLQGVLLETWYVAPGPLHGNSLPCGGQCMALVLGHAHRTVAVPPMLVNYEDVSDTDTETGDYGVAAEHAYAAAADDDADAEADGELDVCVCVQLRHCCRAQPS